MKNLKNIKYAENHEFTPGQFLAKLYSIDRTKNIKSKYSIIINFYDAD